MGICIHAHILYTNKPFVSRITQNTAMGYTYACITYMYIIDTCTEKKSEFSFASISPLPYSQHASCVLHNKHDILPYAVYPRRTWCDFIATGDENEPNSAAVYTVLGRYITTHIIQYTVHVQRNLSRLS